jgi:maltose O-acetyltransferase
MKLYIKVINKLRAKIYSIKYNVGDGCNFGKVKFWDCEKNSINIGKKVVISRKTEICAKSNFKVYIGDKTFINQQCIIRPNVNIGNNVDIAPRVMLMTDTHKIANSNRRAGESQFLPINIGDGCWIGAGSTILGGVTIGKGTIIGAGSVVNKDCEANSLYAGVPAKFIKRLE